MKKIKCIVWDLDNTLWDGTLLEGDDVKLKTGVSEVIKTLDQRGILHSIASKGNYNDAMLKLSEFQLDDLFLFPEIGWDSKSQSIAKIQKNLNIGMDTLIFIDDLSFELDEVKSVHPQVTCIKASQYLNLPSHHLLNPKFITRDSSRRRLTYIEDQKRREEERDFKGPRKEFLASLDIHIQISEAKDDDLKRAEELTVRTNQLNATGKTYSYDELKLLMDSKNHKLLICEMNDKYGAYGKIGLSVVEIFKDYFYIRLLLVSCRVMSIGVGTVLLSYVMHEAKKFGKRVKADFRHTGRNRMMYITFKFANFKEILVDESGTIVLEKDLSSIQEYPSYINLTIK
ncbi:MAG: HAD-IIIC family phosphatase [Candidatus Scalindua sp. AMX11]|nr:MAG: HAD-IIIC family phosphatase [Candidatus Scalindua sp.]NOG85563.1 HAD-IIIC family phosphatase [Planctomycetota bacterium]RZV90300.1 MAG: HAD-IIIC family phosphatase [Candidatus Scalindua sp. SCAELEC01]TDE65018.1 MAG: HAD-IIIC family phosphatase [Candidatus Scalindua sp. AMX11]